MTVNGITYSEHLTRNEVIKMIGEAPVIRVENENCDYTNRVMDTDEYVEFSATIDFINKDKENCTLAAYYYQLDEDVENNELDQLEWKVDHYVILY